MNVALLTLLIGLDARCKTLKTPGYPAYMSATPPRLSGMTRQTLDIQSYKDPELVKVKTMVGHVRPGLQV
jgi:hypothetical protein